MKTFDISRVSLAILREEAFPVKPSSFSANNPFMGNKVDRFDSHRRYTRDLSRSQFSTFLHFEFLTRHFFL